MSLLGAIDFCADEHGVPLEAQSVAQMVDHVLALPAETKVAILAPVVAERKGEFADLVDELLELFGISAYRESFTAELSTGTRRIVELAGLLALDAKVLCLDEPTAGIAQREAEAMAPLLVEIRKELGASMLIIEHDMPLIMAISDRVYCLDLGRVIDAAIAHGVIIELNASPWRLDLDWRLWRKAAERGLLCAINPDAHETDGLSHVRAGINTARKGGLTREQVLTTWPLKRVREWLAARDPRVPLLPKIVSAN